MPSLLSNRDLIDNGLGIRLQGGYLHVGDSKQPLTLDNYFFIYKWDARSIPYVLYTEHELRSIHRAFGHPSVSSLHKVLKKASTEPLAKDVKKGLEEITADYLTCRKHSPSPRRFKLTVGTEDLVFNHHIYVDTMFISGRAVLHIVDEATHFTAASFLKTQSTTDIWKGTLRLCIHTYLSPPGFPLCRPRLSFYFTRV